MLPTEVLKSEKDELIKRLLANEISHAQLIRLQGDINELDLSHIIQRIYDLNRTQVNKIAALDRMLGKIDAIKNSHRNSRFLSKISSDFREKDKGRKVILAEGDSWFNYPVILTDVLDRINMEPDMIIYSLANGGDWLLNMLGARKYVEQLSVIHPDVFLISGGGNDLVGRSRLAAMVIPGAGSLEQGKSEWAQTLIQKATDHPIVPFDEDRFKKGTAHLSKDFYALLMFFHLQYYFLINGILTAGTGDPANGKFPDMKIITQGYDYALPSHDKKWGLNPLRWYRPFIRSLLGHGSWLKTPLQLRGITDPQTQADIIYAMIFLFNEMMIHTGDLFCQLAGKRVFHIDSRGSVGPDGWADELHPLPENFCRTGQTFIDCINNIPSGHGQVYVVNDFYPRKS